METQAAQLVGDCALGDRLDRGRTGAARWWRRSAERKPVCDLAEQDERMQVLRDNLDENAYCLTR